MIDKIVGPCLDLIRRTAGVGDVRGERPASHVLWRSPFVRRAAAADRCANLLLLPGLCRLLLGRFCRGHGDGNADGNDDTWADAGGQLNTSRPIRNRRGAALPKATDQEVAGPTDREM
ncbi:hypothetical protein [Streptomyces sp. NPDC059008]|uniref:hypothetical protein n=1 Tax=Streptomyces sp. NPDC059008 TaxID=3346693 RepID=UPI00369439C9